MADVRLALRYVDNGYHVCPLYANSKVPATKNGFDDASSDKEVVERWFSEVNDFNIGLKVDGFSVLTVTDSVFFTKHREALFTASGICKTPRGYHFYFADANRNTVHFDGNTLRTNGGVIVPDSIIDGGAYEWLVELPPKDKLSPMPAEVLADIPKDDESHTKEQAVVYTQGHRDLSLFKLACQLRRIGLDEGEIAACLLAVNEKRCKPPLPEKQVRQKARNAVKYQPPIEHSWQNVTEMPMELDITKSMQRDDVLVAGVIRHKEIMNIIAPPKAGKSWLVADLAISVATGATWLNMFRTNKANVLLIDNELRYEMICQRFREIIAARHLDPAAVQQNVKVKVCRGSDGTIDALEPFFQSIAADGYKLVIIDALYKALPNWCDENNNATIAKVYAMLSRYAELTGAAFVIVHHTSKGSQSAKSVTDVGAGAGSLSRSADSHMILRPHATPGVMVVDGVFRSFEGIPPFCIRWQYPLWVYDATLSPHQILTTPTHNLVIPSADDLKMVADVLGASSEPLTAHDILRRIISSGVLMSLPMVTACLEQLIKEQKLVLSAGEYGPSYTRAKQ